MKFIVDRSSRLGSAFDIDLRLRPHGSNGLESTSFKQFQSYYSLSGNAQQYERQALIRLRFVAGDIGLGKAVEEERNRYVYSCEPIDIDYALHLRQRQILELCESGKRNVKYGRGGIIDLEYAVQYLQLLYGNEHVDVRNPNILAALDEMKNCELLTSDEEEACRVSLPYLNFLLYMSLISCLEFISSTASFD